MAVPDKPIRTRREYMRVALERDRQYVVLSRLLSEATAESNLYVYQLRQGRWQEAGETQLKALAIQEALFDAQATYERLSWRCNHAQLEE